MACLHSIRQGSRISQPLRIGEQGAVGQDQAARQRPVHLNHKRDGAGRQRGQIAQRPDDGAACANARRAGRRGDSGHKGRMRRRCIGEKHAQRGPRAGGGVRQRVGEQPSRLNGGRVLPFR